MPNRLAHEKSPYLLQHAHNPVDWFPWGEEAFARARAENRLIFLSIGYATCHWCHVMERESFEDAETAQVLNELFVPIKLDREERPDVDQIYMKALHAVGQQGGWPLNMFLAPDLRPVTGGTYFPPTPAHGRPSFRQVLQSVAQAWEREPARLLEAAANLTTFLQPGEAGAGSLPDPTALSRAALSFGDNFDRYRGGFISNGPNKFPPSMALLFLLRSYERTREDQLLEIVETTLSHMVRGGIYDQLGGGLCRYSTDHDWLVPHFEKMLYDNALFAMALTEAYRVTRNERYRVWAMEVFAYLERDMTSAEGAFFSAEDADSEGEEGRFYVWTHGEFQDTLASAGFEQPEIRLLLKLWGVTARGNFEGRNILHETLTREEFCGASGVAAEDLNRLVGRARSALLGVRGKRIRPLLDDKVLTGWNALLISALAQASRAFQEAGMAVSAARAANFLWDRLRLSNGGLCRRFRDGEAKHQGTLSDYALFGSALVDLYRATFQPIYLERATEIAGQVSARFGAPDGGFFDSDVDVANLIVRTIDSYDGVEPSGNSAAARLFLSLARYGVAPAENYERSAGIVRRFSGAALEYPSAHPALLTVADAMAHPSVEVVVVGSGSGLGHAVAELNRLLGPEATLAVRPSGLPDEGSRTDEDVVPILEGRVEKYSGLTYYVCRDLACERPVGSLEETRELLLKR